MNDISKTIIDDKVSATSECDVLQGVDDHHLLSSEGEDLGTAMGTVALTAIAVLALGIFAATLVLR